MYIMINPDYMKYVPDNMRDELYNRMVKDIYYFYNGNKPEENQHIIILDGNPYNLEKNNLVLVSK